MNASDTHLAAPPEALDEDPQIGTVMTARVLAIVPDAPLPTAMQLMAAHGVRHLPVLDGPRCLGIVVESDVLHCLAQWPAVLAAGAPLHVGDVCRSAVRLDSHTRRSAAARAMDEAAADAALVTEQGRLVGIVTATDLIHSLGRTGRPDRRAP